MLYPVGHGVFGCKQLSVEFSDLALWRFALNSQHALALGQAGLAYISHDLDEDNERYRGSETYRMDASRTLPKQLSIAGNGRTVFVPINRDAKAATDSPAVVTHRLPASPTDFLFVREGAFLTVTPKVIDAKNYTLLFEFSLAEVPENSSLLTLNTDQGVIGVANGVLVCFGSPTVAKVSKIAFYHTHKIVGPSWGGSSFVCFSDHTREFGSPRLRLCDARWSLCSLCGPECGQGVLSVQSAFSFRSAVQRRPWIDLSRVLFATLFSC